METDFLSAVNKEISSQVSESGKPALKRPDVFRRILGPTPDETILTGLQIVVDMCSPETFVIPTSYYPPYQIENETALLNQSLETPVSHHLEPNYKTVQTQPSSTDNKQVQVTYEAKTQSLSKETKPVQVTQEVGTQPSNMDVKPIHVASSDKTTKRDSTRNQLVVLPCLINNNAKFKTTATETHDLVPALEYDSNFEQTSSFVDCVEFPYFSKEVKEVNTSGSLEQLTEFEHQSAETPSYYQQNSKIGDDSDISSEITIVRTKTRVLENSGLGDVSFESGYTEGALTSNFPHKSISAYWNVKSSDCTNSCPCSCSESIYKNIEVEVPAVEPVSWNGNPKIPLKANSSESVGKRKVFAANKKNDVGSEHRPMINKRKPSSTQFQRRKTSYTPSNSTYCSNIINEFPTPTKLNDSCIQTSKCKHKVKDDDNQPVERSSTCGNLKSSKNRINENKTKAGKFRYYVDKEVCKPITSLNVEEKNSQAIPKRCKYEPKESMKSRLIQFADEICSARTFYEEKGFGIDTLEENLSTPAKAVLDEYKRKIPTNDDWSSHSKAQCLTPLQSHSVQTIISLGSDKSSCNYLSKFYLSLQKQSITRSVQTAESNCTCTSTHVQTTESSCTSTHSQTCSCSPISKSVQTSICASNTKSERKLEIYSTIFQGPQSSELLRTVDNNSSLSGSSKQVKDLNYSQSQNSHQSTEVTPYTDTSTPPSRKSIDSFQSFTKEPPPVFISAQSERFSYLYCKRQSGNLREPQSKPPSLTARSFDKSKQLHVRTTKSRKRSSGVSPWSHEKPNAVSGKPTKVGNNTCDNVRLNKSFNKNNSRVSKSCGNAQDTNSNESLIILPAPRDLDWTPIGKPYTGCHTQECIKNFEQKYASKLPKHSEKYHIWQENGYVCSTENTKESYNQLPTSNSEHSKGLSGKLSGIGKFLKMFPRRTKNDT